MTQATNRRSSLSSRHHFAASALATIVAIATLAPISPARADICQTLAAGRADIIYICPDFFDTALARLATHRANSQYGGYSSIIVSRSTLHNCFGGTNVRQQIRALIHQALTSWSSPPIHVVLVGGYSNSDTSTYVLPTWFTADPIAVYPNDKGLVASDDPYVAAPWSTNGIPIVSIGRIPVTEGIATADPSRLNDYIDKVIAYETGGLPAWKGYALRVIDDRDLDGNSGARALTHADSLYFAGPRSQQAFSVSSLYGSQTNTAIRNLSVIGAWNGGLGYVLFYGTSGDFRQLSFFTNDQPCGSPFVEDCTVSPCVRGDTLRSTDRTPVVVALTCEGGKAGMWDASSEPIPEGPAICNTLPQYLIMTPHKGAVSLTGPGRAMHDLPGFALGREWYKAAFALDAPTYAEPGLLLKKAKQQSMPLFPSYRTEFAQVMVLGDPAIRFFAGTPALTAVGEYVPTSLAIRLLRTPTHELALSVDLPEPGSYRIRVYDVQGRLLLKSEYAATNASRNTALSIASSQLKSGIYFAVIDRGSMVASTRAVLMH